MTPLKITAFSVVSGIGIGTAATVDALRSRRTGLRQNDFLDAALPTWIGRVDAVENEPVAHAMREFDCRNNRLAQLALVSDGFAGAVGRARKRYGAHRVGVFLGTSTSGILETERAYAQRQSPDDALTPAFRYSTTHSLYSPADFTRRFLQLRGPAHVASTACSSSAKVFADAARYIEAGICDAAIVGGVDSLCHTTLYGFASLGLLSDDMCRPCDRNRRGISIGEAAGFALLEKDGAGETALCGFGESADAYHMSTPRPDGSGAATAMEQALARAGLDASQIDYINMHGTATQVNDSAEDRGIFTVFGNRTPCSSTKGWTGHTLGAAGIVEAVISLLAIRMGMIPGTLNLSEPDESLGSRIVRDNAVAPVRFVLSNSFGFGGNNCSLIFGAAV